MLVLAGKSVRHRLRINNDPEFIISSDIAECLSAIYNCFRKRLTASA